MVQQCITVHYLRKSVKGKYLLVSVENVMKSVQICEICMKIKSAKTILFPVNRQNTTTFVKSAILTRQCVITAQLKVKCHIFHF